MSRYDTVLIVSVIMLVGYAIVVYFDVDRSVKNELISLSSLAKRYSLLPKSDRRSVVLLKCDESGPDMKTLKSLLDQSVRVHDIAIETDYPRSIDDETKTVSTVHKMNTCHVRECELDTVIIIAKNGVTYPYDFVEKSLAK